jgi:hypothetical protein
VTCRVRETNTDTIIVTDVKKYRIGIQERKKFID